MVFYLLVKIYGPAITCWHADLALGTLQKEALGRIHHTDCGHRLRKREVDALDGCKPRIIVIRDSHGTIFGADTATGTLVRIHVAGLLHQINREIAGISPDPFHLGIGHDDNIGMGRALQKFGRQDAHGTIIGGKGLVQLAHLPANGSGFIHQVNFEPGIGRVQSRLYAADPCAHNHHSANGFFCDFGHSIFLPGRRSHFGGVGLIF